MKRLLFIEFGPIFFNLLIFQKIGSRLENHVSFSVVLYARSIDSNGIVVTTYVLVIERRCFYYKESFNFNKQLFREESICSTSSSNFVVIVVHYLQYYLY